MTLAIGNYTSAWHYKYAGGTCSTTAVSSDSSAAVSGLTANTSYTFSAYGDNTCSTLLATAAAFPTLPPKPAKPTVAVNTTSSRCPRR